MSCRVFKRGVEDATYNAIIKVAQSLGAQWLAAEYIQTAKNGYVADLLGRLGFVAWEGQPGVPLPEDWGHNGHVYIQLLSNTSPKQHYIEVVASMQHGGKPWRYLLVPHSAITANSSLAGLKRQFLDNRLF
jgi:hypothetical protein